MQVFFDWQLRQSVCPYVRVTGAPLRRQLLRELCLLHLPALWSVNRQHFHRTHLTAAHFVILIFFFLRSTSCSKQVIATHFTLEISPDCMSINQAKVQENILRCVKFKWACLHNPFIARRLIRHQRGIFFLPKEPGNIEPGKHWWNWLYFLPSLYSIYILLVRLYIMLCTYTSSWRTF